MKKCNHCEGFIPEDLNYCPNCETKLTLSSSQKAIKKVLLGLSIGGAAMTLMACYGAPPRGQNIKLNTFLLKSEQESKEINRENQINKIKKTNEDISKH